MSLYLELNHKSENPDELETDAKQTQVTRQLYRCRWLNRYFDKQKALDRFLKKNRKREKEIQRKLKILSEQIELIKTMCNSLYKAVKIKNSGNRLWFCCLILPLVIVSTDFDHFWYTAWNTFLSYGMFAQIEDDFLTMKKKLKDLTLRVEQLEAILNERFSSGWMMKMLIVNF